MKNAIALTVALLLPAFGTQATDTGGSSAVQVEVKAEIEVTIKTEDGREEVKRMPAVKVPPGDAVIYTLHARNTGEKPASDVVVTDPIPEHMEYVDGSESAAGARVTFSVDGGKSFAAKNELNVPGEDGKPRAAVAADFTHIRWQLEQPIAPGAAHEVSFRARVE